MLKIRSYLIAALTLGVICLATPPRAVAATVNMFQTLLPVPGEVDPTGGTVLITITVPVIAPTFTGSLTSTVIANDASNPLGGLTFTYLLSNDATSSHPIGRFTVNGYNGSLTDVSYQAPTTGRVPTLVNRPISDVLGFSYLSGIGPGVLSPGLTSALLVVQTDASAYVGNIASAINGTVATIPTFSPVPEPATAALCGLGAILVYRRRAR